VSISTKLFSNFVNRHILQAPSRSGILVLVRR